MYSYRDALGKVRRRFEENLFKRKSENRYRPSKRTGAVAKNHVPEKSGISSKNLKRPNGCAVIKQIACTNAI